MTVEDKNINAGSEIFSHVLLTHYTPAKGTSWLSNKYFRSGNDIITTRDADKTVSHWLNLFQESLTAYKTNNVLILWGDDFAHENAYRTYRSLDAIIRSIETRLEM